jgi:hypothetical protein
VGDDSVPQPPWRRMDAQRRSQRQELRNARLPGGRKQINSGRAGWFSKRDNRLGGYLVETRGTDTGSYRLSVAEWEALVRDAMSTPPGQLPAIQLDIGNHQLFIKRLQDEVFFQGEIDRLMLDVEERDKEIVKLRRLLGGRGIANAEAE